MWFGGQGMGPHLVRRITRYGSGVNPFGPLTDDDLVALADGMAQAGRSMAELELVAPPAFGDAMAYCNRLRLELEAVEARARALAAEKGKGFVGETRVLRMRPTSKPVSPEGRWGVRPRVACRDKWKRIEALGRLAAFAEAYRAALRTWRGGRSDVVFPAGTYLVRVTHGVACAPAG
jgi:hypothetical protein